MTVGTKVHQALASLHSLEGQFETFALDTDNQQAKQLYNQCHRQLQQISRQLADRVHQMEQEEPTYQISGGSGCCGGHHGGSRPSETASDLTGISGMAFSNVDGGRSTGSLASTGDMGQGPWSSPVGSIPNHKSTKKNSR